MPVHAINSIMVLWKHREMCGVYEDLHSIQKTDADFLSMH